MKPFTRNKGTAEDKTTMQEVLGTPIVYHFKLGNYFFIPLLKVFQLLLI